MIDVFYVFGTPQPVRSFWIQQSEIEASVPQIENEPVASWPVPPPR